MKNLNKKIQLLLAIFVGVVSADIQAAIINFTPNTQTVVLGDTVTVDVSISENNTTSKIAGFDLFMNFNSTLLSLSNVVFGTGLDLLGLGSLQDDVLISDGLVEVAETSFDSRDDLFALQPEEFVLFSLVFNTISTGTTNVALADQDLLTDPAKSMLVEGSYYPVAFTSDFAAITITDTNNNGPLNPVPVPAGIWLISLACLVVFRPTNNQN